MLGEDSIRDFAEANKRARLCDVFYDNFRNLLLSQHDWSFARGFKKLQQLVIADSTILPYGEYAYQLPADCLTPRDLWPRGSRDQWEVYGDKLYCSYTSVALYYTAKITDPTKFSDPFAHLLAAALAVRLCMPVTQNEKMEARLAERFKMQEMEAWETDANIGNTYREPDGDPNNDSFVNPDVLFFDPTYPSSTS